MYLLPPLIERLQPSLLAMKPGTRIVAYEFSMGSWEPDEVTEIGNGTAYLWIVPAFVFADWKIEAGDKRYEVRFEQKYQKITGTLKSGKAKISLRDARLRGAEIWFTLVDDNGVRREFAGRVAGRRIQGTMTPDIGPKARFVASF